MSRDADIVIDLRADAITRDSETRMTPEEAARWIGIGKSYLYKLTSGKKIPHYKVGRKILFDRGELEEWMNTKRVAPTGRPERKTENKQH